jgi:hypothetical protein
MGLVALVGAGYLLLVVPPGIPFGLRLLGLVGLAGVRWWWHRQPRPSSGQAADGRSRPNPASRASWAGWADDGAGAWPPAYPPGAAGARAGWGQAAPGRNRAGRRQAGRRRRGRGGGGGLGRRSRAAGTGGGAGAWWQQGQGQQARRPAARAAGAARPGWDVGWPQPGPQPGPATGERTAAWQPWPPGGAGWPGGPAGAGSEAGPGPVAVAVLVDRDGQQATIELAPQAASLPPAVLARQAEQAVAAELGDSGWQLEAIQPPSPVPPDGAADTWGWGR